MLIIFDCDGVLRSVTWQAIYNSYIVIIKHLGKNPADYFTDIESFKEWYNLNWQVNLKKIGGVKKKHHPELNHLFHKLYDTEVHVFPWANDTLREISAKHIVTIFSSSLSSSVKKSLRHSAKNIAYIIGCEHVRKIKPHPEGIRILMRKFMISPSKTIMIGDTNVDIIAGKNAGVITGLVKWGLLSSEKDIQFLEPDYIFSQPEDLLIIKNL